MVAFFDFLFGRQRPRAADSIPTSIPQTLRTRPVQKTTTAKQEQKPIRLTEHEFDPDGDQSDLIWYGFVIWDDQGVGNPV